MLEGLLGSFLGGTFRLVPEVLSWLDKKNERQHELSMFDKQLRADELRSQQAIAEAEAQGQIALDAAGMQALIESIKTQGQKTGSVIIDALSASVRPVLTYWWAMVLYTAVLASRFYLLLQDSGVSSPEAIVQLWGPNEQSLVSSLFTFWFLDRVIKKRSQ